MAFDAKTGESLWKLRVGNGPTMGLTFNKGIIYANTAFNANVLAIDATSGKSSAYLLGNTNFTSISKRSRSWLSSRSATT